MTDSDRATPPEVLDSKRDATRYQVLVEIAARQPAVSQTEIAEAIGVTSQAVSDYVRDLVEHEYVEKEGRGRYTVTKEGVDWLISRTDSLEAYLNRVSSDVLGSVDVDAAIAMDDIAEGSDVGLLMRKRRPPCETPQAGQQRRSPSPLPQRAKPSVSPISRA